MIDRSKIVAALAGLLALTALLAGCGDDDTDADPAELTIESDPETDERFITAVRNGFPGAFDGVSDDALVETAKSACRALLRGGTVDELVATVGDSAGSDARADAFLVYLAAGVAVYCPGFSRLFE